MAFCLTRNKATLCRRQQTAHPDVWNPPTGKLKFRSFGFLVAKVLHFRQVRMLFVIKLKETIEFLYFITYLKSNLPRMAWSSGGKAGKKEAETSPCTHTRQPLQPSYEKRPDRKANQFYCIREQPKQDARRRNKAAEEQKWVLTNKLMEATVSTGLH